ncbi:hypothetical protein G5B30_01655 [Sphingobacterium sp. SGG-5]|uniref:endonuclease/exonuclease/phosphatase family protein n=1 Tax=Sphingobacterium sp. SGG-5 TaxID=2710881 RepID=UPI0013EC8438|nr:endonuclease/exonuclease/phosphatase family protein [Sphingobacterium sp. SGG-5]NGM60611.1 hypothetical protein [Sphingobacterium sp. SGG-5]
MTKSIITPLFRLIGILFLLLNTACGTQKSSSYAAKNQEFNILTYNIHHANPPSKPDVIDIDAICEVIRQSDADVVALQEVDVRTNRSGHIDQAKVIAQKVDMHYHFFKAIDHDGGEYGLAILSRLPIRNPETIPLPQVEKAEDRILALLQVKINNTWITIANTHLDATRSHNNRIAQMQFIMDKTASIHQPIILCGDLNSKPTSEAIRILDKYFKRTCIDDCLPTVPQHKPRSTIDYIATKHFPWEQKSIEVIPETYASDHRPVKITFKCIK